MCCMCSLASGLSALEEKGRRRRRWQCKARGGEGIAAPPLDPGSPPPVTYHVPPLFFFIYYLWPFLYSMMIQKHINEEVYRLDAIEC